MRLEPRAQKMLILTLEPALTLVPAAESVDRAVPKGPPRRLLISALSPRSSRAFCRVVGSGLSRTFVVDDFVSDRNFFKQFFSGIFIVVAMTGLSQDMMQTTLSCRNLSEARKNMLLYGSCFVPFNLLLLFLGALMIIFSTQTGIVLPENLLFCLAAATR